MYLLLAVEGGTTTTISAGKRERGRWVLKKITEIWVSGPASEIKKRGLLEPARSQCSVVLGFVCRIWPFNNVLLGF
ncbi:hypothetical protein SLEP1_g54782 [Rubroshorea leprosula]|uniref:Uncharacterized protein n=1 Tax=Rubroshorea leprosula TaxID=152421 RepID=A0AAV5MDH2_9ROSI|nr:hypothetical protein SLEP1_g54782 [Rubroshorea leprosula]